jgi:hypothetical protein
MDGFLIQLLASIISLFIFWIFFTILFRLIEKRKVKDGIKEKKETKEKKSNWVVICPKCGSIDTERLFLSGKADKFWKAFNPVKYKCNSCKFEGIFPEANVDMLEEIQNDIRKNKTVSQQKPKPSKNK